MTRREEIEQAAMQVGGVHPDWDALKCFRVGYKEGAKWADKTMIDKVCRCFCDDICDKGRVGMCYHKHDGQQQVKNSFKYNECNELKLIRKEVEE